MQLFSCPHSSCSRKKSFTKIQHNFEQLVCQVNFLLIIDSWKCCKSKQWVSETESIKGRNNGWTCRLSSSPPLTLLPRELSVLPSGVFPATLQSFITLHSTSLTEPYSIYHRAQAFTKSLAIVTLQQCFTLRDLHQLFCLSVAAAVCNQQVNIVGCHY